jgi:hypothetical protein
MQLRPGPGAVARAGGLPEERPRVDKKPQEQGRLLCSAQPAANRGSPAPATHPNNIPFSSGGWKPTRQAQTEKWMQICKQKQQKSSEHQSSEQIPLQSAPLSAEQREQERHQKDKEDAVALRRIEEAAAEKKNTILRRKATREAAENRKVCESEIQYLNHVSGQVDQ